MPPGIGAFLSILALLHLHGRELSERRYQLEKTLRPECLMIPVTYTAHLHLRGSFTGGLHFAPLALETTQGLKRLYLQCSEASNYGMGAGGERWLLLSSA